MADSIKTIVFKDGLDTVTPPLLQDAGSVIDCLNYEITDVIGYRRIDGYERYDGFPDGAIYEYYRLEIVAEAPADQSLIVPGSIVVRSDQGLDPVRIGVVLGGPFEGNLYDISPFVTADNFILTEEFLLQQDGISMINLQSGLGLLKILGEDDGLGATFTLITPSGVEISIAVSGTPTRGGILVPAQEYLDNIRAYSAAMRAMVLPAPGDIAGLNWLEDRLFAAVNATEVLVNVAAASPQPVAGRRMRWNGRIYRLVDAFLRNPGTINEYIFSLVPIGTTSTVDDSLVEILVDGTTVTTWATNVSTSGDVRTDNSQYAAMGYFNNTGFASTRGFVFLTPANRVSFNAGANSGVAGPPLTFDDAAVAEDSYYITGSGGTVLRARLANIVRESGAWASSDATGRAQFVVTDVIAGNRDYILNGDEVHKVYPTTGTSRVMTINSAPSIALLAGTRMLDQANTRYQWDTANFYGHTSMLSSYGATGASPAFWVNARGYGNILTGVEEELDTPKYVSFYAGRLALAYERGSVFFSVVGNPFSFRGEDGAAEIATGDRITGLLEMPGDTLAVFGSRTIRKVVGGVDLQLGTISGSSGAFDYSALLVGQDAVYAGVNGISTLQQTAAYGDFAGQRLTDRASNYLRPRLVTGAYSLEQGGVAMAYVVRTKNQYRLVLNTGETVILTISQEGPKIMLGNWGLVGETKVPYAWSSEVADNGRERIHVAWARREGRNQAYELEAGWGFDGRTFRHFFDTAHVFDQGAANFIGIEKVRLYGQGYGVATLNVKSSGIEENFDQSFHTGTQDISIPRNIVTLFDRMRPVTNITVQANWGLGVKLRFSGTINEGSNLTEPSHICQAAVLHVRSKGALDG